MNITSMAHGGSAMGRDDRGRPVFVPYAIPGEEVRASVTARKRNYAHAELVEVLSASPDRVVPRCPHFGVCGGCHYQHMGYDAQLRAKQQVAIDQLQRIGGLQAPVVRPTIPSPLPWTYAKDVSLSPTPNGELGFWSPSLAQVMPIEKCYIIQDRLMELWLDIDLVLPELRKMTLRMGDNETLMIALEVEDVEPPELLVDFPVSVAIVMPDKTAASLVGDLYLVRTVKGRPFRFSAGCFFQPNPAAAEQLVEALLAYADLGGAETILEAYSGVGMLTAFLAGRAGRVTAIERNPDAIADAVANLEDEDNVTLYQGEVEEVLPLLDISPDVLVVDPPPNGLSPSVLSSAISKKPARIIYVSSDVATLARDGKELARAGYRLVEMQPIDMAPQTFRVDSLSLWLANP